MAIFTPKLAQIEKYRSQKSALLGLSKSAQQIIYTLIDNKNNKSSKALLILGCINLINIFKSMK